MFDALHTDQQQRWRKGERVLVEWYAQRHPELARDPQALTEMIFNEIALRESLGERPTLEEYLVRFAGCEETLRSRSAARASKPAGSVADEFATVVAGAISPAAKTIVGSNKPIIPGGANQTKENVNTIVDARTKAAMTPVSPSPAPKSFDTIVDPRTKAPSTPVSPSPVSKSFDTIVDPRTKAANTPGSQPSRPAPKSPDTIVDARTKSASTPASPLPSPAAKSPDTIVDARTKSASTPASPLPPPAPKSSETIVDARTKAGSTSASPAPPPATESSETDFSLAPQPSSPRRSQGLRQ